MAGPPFPQNVTFHGPRGTPHEVPLKVLDSYMQYCIRICTNYGAQLGASIILLVVLLLLTKPEKRVSAVFILNCLALLFNTIRLVCEIVYFTGPFTELYRFISYDFRGIPTGAYAASVLGVVLGEVLLVCVEASLVLQTQVVCSTFRARYRYVLLATSVVIAMVPLGMRMGYVVEASKNIVKASGSKSIQWLESSTNIALTISICFFCVVFVSKLGFAIKQRKRLGVREFGPMKVIFIMGCQTMLVPGRILASPCPPVCLANLPAFISILQYIVIVPELSSNVITVVTISLPLSSIWAGSTLTPTNRSRSQSSHRLWNLFSLDNSNKSRQESTGTYSGTTANTCYSAQNSKQQPDGEENYGICVEREISVHSHHQDTSPV